MRRCSSLDCPEVTPGFEEYECSVNLAVVEEARCVAVSFEEGVGF
jgi:hypothetical protein